MTRSTTISLLLALMFLQACSAIVARQEEAQFHKELTMKDEAWIAARLRLKEICSNPPTSVEEYRRGAELRRAGSDPFRGCDLRLMKLTNSPFTDDWDWVWLPPHTTIVQVHEAELRNRVQLKIYEEYMLAVAYHLARATDTQEITPQEHRLLFNFAWS